MALTDIIRYCLSRDYRSISLRHRGLLLTPTFQGSPPLHYFSFVWHQMSVTNRTYKTNLCREYCVKLDCLRELPDSPRQASIRELPNCPCQTSIVTPIVPRRPSLLLACSSSHSLLSPIQVNKTVISFISTLILSRCVVWSLSCGTSFCALRMLIGTSPGLLRRWVFGVFSGVGFSRSLWLIWKKKRLQCWNLLFIIASKGKWNKKVLKRSFLSI